MDQDQDTEVCLATLQVSQNAAKAQQMVQQADWLITAAEKLLSDSERKLRAAVAKRESYENCRLPGRPP